MKAAHTKARKSYDRQAATVTALTLPAGTANSTLVAVPDPTDTPATADALRDDLVTNVIPVINADILDLGAKINEIRTALRNAGLML
jgi:hypothetical protein